MADDQDDDSKTEDPSHHRLEEAAKKGQIVYSKEVNNFLMLAAFAAILTIAGPGMMARVQHLYAPFLIQPELFETDLSSLGHILTDAGMGMLAVLLLPFALFIAAALFGGFAQTRFNISAEPIMPKLEKLSPMKGLGRMFSRKSFAEFVKGVIKITVVGVIAYLAVRPKLSVVNQLPDMDMAAMLEVLAALTARMMIGVLIVMFFIALVDYLFQRFEFMKQMRMSKQELKEEYKQQEGDPHIKSRLRALRMEKAKKRMMAAVPTADVVVTNPTHYAVALTYNSTDTKAPIVVAKGADLIAKRIREIAAEHDVPIVENKPLARTLYDTVDLDQEIPFDQYKAVAEVIGYVYKLKGKRA